MALDGASSRKRPRRSIGDQIASPNIVCDEELTTMPIKLTSENVRGTEISCGSSAADGLFAREAKSGAFVTSVAMLLIHDIKLITISQANSDP